MTGQLKTALVLLLLLPGLARAGMDAPGEVSFYWEASEDEVFQDYPVPEDAFRDQVHAYFSSDASTYGSEGVLIWSGVELEDADGLRYGMLLLDLDLTRAPLDGRTPMPHGAIRAEYIEKRGDQILFEGQVFLGDVWILDVLYNEGDEGAIEGTFEMIFADSGAPGSRAFVDAHFVTRPSPAGLRSQYGIVDEGPGVYTDVSCGGDVYIGNEGCDCGGEDPGSGGCEGDTTGDSGGCEGDSSSGGCEGDSGGGCEGSGSSGCDGDTGGCGDTGGGACSAANAAVGPGYRRQTAPLRALMRMFPWAIGILFVALLKRKYRR